MKATDLKHGIMHITPIKNLDKILEEGLYANADGEIFVFEDTSISFPAVKVVNGEPIIERRDEYIGDLIAMNQIFAEEYAQISIDPDGIEVELEPDNVAEFSAKWQWIVKQPFIAPWYLVFWGSYKLTPEGYKEI